MNVGSAVRERLLELCSGRNITVNRLATMSGVTQSTLTNILSGRSNGTTVSAIEELRDGPDITITEFSTSELFENPEQEIH